MKQVLALSLIKVVREKDNGTNEAGVYTDSDGTRYWVETHESEIPPTVTVLDEFKKQAQGLMEAAERALAETLY